MLFYFTGTGNSLYVAKGLERQPISIPQVMHREDLDLFRRPDWHRGPHFTASEVPAMVQNFWRRPPSRRRIST